MENYKLLGFRKSKNSKKKYDAILFDDKIKYVSFGDINYQHYKDTTPDKLYSHLDHVDKKRRKNYIKRASAKNYHLKKYSPAYFSYNYLW